MDGAEELEAMEALGGHKRVPRKGAEWSMYFLCMRSDRAGGREGSGNILFPFRYTLTMCVICSKCSHSLKIVIKIIIIYVKIKRQSSRTTPY